MWAVLETGDLRAATAIGEELMRIVTPLGDYFAIGTTASNVALVNGMAGNTTTGLTTMRNIVRSFDEAPDTEAVAFQHTMGMLHLWNGDLDDAVRWLGRGIGHVTENGKEWKDRKATRCLIGMAAALRRLGRVEEAEPYAARAVRLAATYGAPQVLADALDEQAFLIHDTDPSRARDLHYRALTLRSDNHLRTYLLVSIDALAMLEAGTGHHAEAVRLLAAGDTARHAISYPRPPVEHANYEAIVTALRESLGADEFAALSNAGAAQSLDDTVAALLKRRRP
jgi:hypothetical protein